MLTYQHMGGWYFHCGIDTAKESLQVLTYADGGGALHRGEVQFPANAVLMLGQRLRRWPNNKLELVRSLVPHEKLQTVAVCGRRASVAGTDADGAWTTKFGQVLLMQSQDDSLRRCPRCQLDKQRIQARRVCWFDKHPVRWSRINGTQKSYRRNAGTAQETRLASRCHWTYTMGGWPCLPSPPRGNGDKTRRQCARHREDPQKAARPAPTQRLIQSRTVP